MIFSNDISRAISTALKEIGNPPYAVLADTNTAELVLPRIAAEYPAMADAPLLTIGAGERHKNLGALFNIWSRLIDLGANRSWALVCLGGGMVTDVGGMAAATYMRGMHCINIPTTLLGAVDASVGGKTAVNFRKLKNQIGVFSVPDETIISTRFFDTLPAEEILSGYAEMLKHGLLDSPITIAKLLEADPLTLASDPDAFLKEVETSVAVKRHYAEADLTEHGIRKALNLGHTAAHAIEAIALERMQPVPHGYAVAWGTVVALVISHMTFGFDSTLLHSFARYVATCYGPPAYSCPDYTALLRAMSHDKKNGADSEGRFSFTLLEAPGKPRIDCLTTPDTVRSALDITADLLGA